MIDEYMNAAEVPQVAGHIVSAIAPHAGYEYSGKVAGYAFGALRENAQATGAPDTVVVLGLSHRRSFPGVALMDGAAFETPLGRTEIDREAVELLADAEDRIRIAYALHGDEWSAENEVPFVQVALPHARLVVGLTGDHDLETVSQLTSALNLLTERRRVVVLASSDLLHHPDYELVTRTDRDTLDRMSVLDLEGLRGAWGDSNQVCCGLGPVSAAMLFARAQGCRRGTVLHYRNSGDDHPEGRGHWVVGYGAIVFAVED
jgi:AmmeMemoRadiSam system protein B